MRKIKLLLGASILLLSSQVNAGIISGLTAMEGAELWKYAVRGSVSNDQGSLDIFGSMLIDTTVREWYPHQSPRSEPCDGFQTPGTCQNFFQILSFDLRIGDLSFFGGGPFINEGGGNSNVNALYFDTSSFSGFPGSFGYGARDWFLEGTGDYSDWFGQYHRFLNPDGSFSSVSDIFQTAPEFIEMSSGRFYDENEGFDDLNLDGSASTYMHLTRVARVPEPSAILLFGIGLIGLIGFTRRRKAA